MSTRTRIAMMKHRLTVLVAMVLLLAVPESAAQEWHIITELPGSRTGMGVAALGDHIFVIAGRTRAQRASTTVLLYDPVANRWSDDVGQLRQPRVNPGVVTFGNKIFVIGGRNHEGEVLRSVEVFDPDQNTWREFGELKRPREGATAVVVRDQIFVIGGSDQNERALESIETYNIIESRWEEIGEWKLDNPRVSPGVAVIEPTIYVFGGFNVFGPVGGLQSYNTDLATTASTDMPIPRGGLAAIQAQKKIFVIGGRSRDRVLNTVTLYRAFENTWADVAPMRVARFSFGAVRFMDTIYVFGGIGQEGNPVASVEAFGPLSISSEKPNAPEDFGLEASFPNPFSGATSLEIHVSGQVPVTARLQVFDLSGRLVKTLAADVGVGDHTYNWDGRNHDGALVASGVYVARLRQGSHEQIQKLVLIR